MEEIENLISELEQKLKAEITNWFQGLKGSKPEALPWFTHGLRGFLRKLYYNNAPDNPDWKHYESVRSRMTLSEYASVKQELNNLFEAAPMEQNAIDQLIARLMPIIKSYIIKAKNLQPTPPPVQNPVQAAAATTPTADSTPETATKPETKLSEPDEPPVTNKRKSEKFEKPESKPEKEPEEKISQGEASDEEVEKALNDLMQQKPEESKSQDVPTTDNSKEIEAETEPELTEEDEPNEVYRSLINYTKNNNFDSLSKVFAKYNIPLLRTSSGIYGRQGEGRKYKITVDSEKGDLMHIAESLVKLVESLTKLTSSKLEAIGLKKSDLNDLGDIDFWKGFKKKDSTKLLGIKIPDKVINAINKYLSNSFSETRKYKNKLLVMLSENN